MSNCRIIGILENSVQALEFIVEDTQKRIDKYTIKDGYRRWLEGRASAFEQAAKFAKEDVIEIGKLLNANE